MIIKHISVITLFILLGFETICGQNIKIEGDSATVYYAERDIVIHNYLFGLEEYINLVDDIDRQKKILGYIPDSLIQDKLEESKILNELEDQLEKFKDDVFRLYETFTETEINTERLREAKEYFDKGEFLQADAMLKPKEMNSDLEKLINKDEVLDKEKAKVKEGREQLANEFLIKALLWKTFYNEPDWFEKSNEYYTQALHVSRSEQILFNYARFLQEHKQFLKAYPLYQEALGIYRKLAKTNQQAYLPYLGTTLNNLAVLQRDINELEKAEESYKESFGYPFGAPYEGDICRIDCWINVETTVRYSK